MKSVSISILSLILTCACFPNQVNAQIWKKIPFVSSDNSTPNKPAPDPDAEAIIKRLRTDIDYLSSDPLEGRATGTKGEAMAGTFIERRFADLGIFPPGQTYRRGFKFESGKDLTPEVRFMINGKYVSIPEDVFPAPYSPAGDEENFMMPESKEFGSPWVMAFYENEHEANDPDFDWVKSTLNRSKFAISRGASSVLFYDNYGGKFFPSYNKKAIASEHLSVPVLVMNKKGYDANLKGMQTIQPLMMHITYRKEYQYGTNILGYINNNAAQTVIIGAHYDYLGFTTHPSAPKTKIIFSGADDNASGVAVMLSLADKIKRAQLKKFNYLFIAFSGKEEGMAGSQAFVDDKHYNLKQVAYMINIDRVGKLSQTKTLLVDGVGSSSIWSSLLGNIPNNFTFVTARSEMRPSDHKSFYDKQIPVLSFSTEENLDDGKPSDDASKINYNGTKDILYYLFNITSSMEKVTAVPLYMVDDGHHTISSYVDLTKKETPVAPKPMVTTAAPKKKPGDVAVKRAPSRPGARPNVNNLGGKVNMGIMPDYNYKDYGVKIGSIIAEKPAAKAGLLEGDVLVQLGNLKIINIQTFMDAVKFFNPGDHVVAKVKRGNAIQEFPVSF